jgi:hypothetical protein
LTSLTNPGPPDNMQATAVPLASVMSRQTIRSAMDLLITRHGLDDREEAFEIMRRVSQVGNVKLRTVAAQLVARDAEQHDDASSVRSKVPRPPQMTFARVGLSAKINRSAVLAELMQVARKLAGAQGATVQTVDAVHGGLLIEKYDGFDQAFIDYFSYLDNADCTCGSALADAKQFVLPDVAVGGLYDPASQAVMIGGGARCVISTPLRDSKNRVVGVVTSHHPAAHQLPNQATLKRIQGYADDAGRWLQWHDAVVMPLMLNAVHSRAALRPPAQ